MKRKIMIEWNNYTSEKSSEADFINNVREIMKEYGNKGYMLSGTANVFYRQMNKTYITDEEKENIRSILPKIDKRLPEYLEKYKENYSKVFNSD